MPPSFKTGLYLVRAIPKFVSSIEEYLIISTMCGNRTNAQHRSVQITPTRFAPALEGTCIWSYLLSYEFWVSKCSLHLYCCCLSGSRCCGCVRSGCVCHRDRNTHLSRRSNSFRSLSCHSFCLQPSDNEIRHSGGRKCIVDNACREWRRKRVTRRTVPFDLSHF